MTRAILHIGTEKTGTTALQSYLARHRDALDAHGFRYARAPGKTNHTALAAYAADDAVRDDLRLALGIDSAADLAAFRHRLEGDLRAERDAYRDRTFVFSNEHLHSRLTSPAAVARIAALLGALFDEVRVIVYLRRQDEVAVSLYSTMLKAGGTRAEVIGEGASGYYDYAALLDRWSGAFGRQALTVSRFDRRALVGGSIVDDVCARFGLPLLGGAEASANESLAPGYQEYLRRMNVRLPRLVDGRPNPERGSLAQRVAAVGAGSGRRPARAEAEAFYAGFAASNEAVRREWFSAEATLFDTDFSRYPEIADPPRLTADDALDITAALWAQVEAERRTLQAEVAFGRGRLLLATGNAAAAEAGLARATMLNPAHPKAARFLDRARRSLKEQDAGNPPPQGGGTRSVTEGEAT